MKSKHAFNAIIQNPGESIAKTIEMLKKGKKEK